MFKRIVWTVFNAAVVLVAAGAAVWLPSNGHSLHIGGLLLAMGAILGAVAFGLRLIEGFGPDRLSIWAGPAWSVRTAALALAQNGDVLRDAA